MAGSGDGRCTLRSVVFDCPDPPALAAFYGALLEGEVDTADPTWCEVHVDGAGMKLAFQRADPYTPPVWPHGSPQQLHLDLSVGDVAAASRRAVALGAQVLGPPVTDDDGTFQVHADPAGHPFCFCLDQ